MVSSSNIEPVNMSAQNSVQAARNAQAGLQRMAGMLDARESFDTLQNRAIASNIENARDYMNTSDGWMQTIHNVLGRMGELAVSANDGTKSPVELDALQAEFGQMQQTIQSITTGPDALARFNGIPLFQGDTVHFADDLSYDTPNLSSDSGAVIGELGGSPITWAGAVSENSLDSPDAATALALAGNYLGSVRAEGGALMNSIQGLSSPLTNAFAMELLQTPGNLVASGGHLLTQA